MPTLISGSLAYDYIMNFPDSFKNHIMPEQIHILNVCFMVDKLERGWGGTAANIAFTMKMLGGEPLIVSSVGKDGQEYIDYLKKSGLETKYIKKDKGLLSASAYITTDADDNQVIAFFNGPLQLASEINISEVGEKPKIVLISPTHKEVMKKHLKEAWENDLETVFDPGQQITGFGEIELKKMVGQAKFLIGNDYEIKLLQKRTGWDTEELLKNVEVLIITLGEKGSVVLTNKGEEIEAGICPPKSFDDPTGAGDAYRAGFFVGYELGYDWKTCAQMGAVAASYAIEEYGTQIIFTQENFCERYEKTFGNKISLIR